MGFFDKIKQMVCPSGGCCGGDNASSTEKPEEPKPVKTDSGCCGEDNCECEEEADLTKPSGGCDC